MTNVIGFWVFIRLQNYLYFVLWDVQLHSLTPKPLLDLVSRSPVSWLQRSVNDHVFQYCKYVWTSLPQRSSAFTGCASPERISFKLAVITYRSIHGTSPSYLQSCFIRVSDMTSRRRLQSSTSHRLDVPPVRFSTVGKRAFPVSGATVWNDLPLHVASALSIAVFRQWLKTFLFSRSYKDTIIWLVCYYHHSLLLSGHL